MKLAVFWPDRQAKLPGRVPSERRERPSADSAGGSTERTSASEVSGIVNFARGAVLWLSGVRLTLHVVLMLLCSQRSTVWKDLDRWGQILFQRTPASSTQRVALFVRLMTFAPEYRNLFYHRTGALGKMLSVICRPLPTLYIWTLKIGPGLFIQHGFCTVIAAAEIGDDCWINQQVTIGYSNTLDRPTLGNNVSIGAGAKVIGKVSIGENSKVGANAVVVKDVPANATVVGVPAYIVKRNGVKVRHPL
jgi:serine O-acetyltransferase